MKKGVRPQASPVEAVVSVDGATTLGNVTVGNAAHVQEHERSHAWQGRLLGPFHLPPVAIDYEVAALVPYWLICGRDQVGRFGDYFLQGVVGNELISYAWFS